MKKTIIVILATAGLLASVNAEVMYIDFGSDDGATTAVETYNEIHPTTSGAGASLSGTGETFSNLVDTNGTATGASLHILTASTGGDIRSGDDGNGHDAITGIDAKATGDSIWMNNGDDAGIMTMTLTYAGLTGSKYDLFLVPGPQLRADFVWDVITGTGDDDTETFTTATDTTGTAQWTEVSPVGGTIVLTGTMDATINFTTGRASFMSLEAVPEPGTLGLVAAFGGAVLFIRRRFMI